MLCSNLKTSNQPSSIKASVRCEHKKSLSGKPTVVAEEILQPLVIHLIPKVFNIDIGEFFGFGSQLCLTFFVGFKSANKSGWKNNDKPWWMLCSCPREKGKARFQGRKAKASSWGWGGWGRTGLRRRTQDQAEEPPVLKQRGQGEPLTAGQDKASGSQPSPQQGGVKWSQTPMAGGVGCGSGRETHQPWRRQAAGQSLGQENQQPGGLILRCIMSQLLAETLTLCGRSAACRSSSRWRGPQHLVSQSAQKHSPWSHSHHTPPVNDWGWLASTDRSVYFMLSVSQGQMEDANFASCLASPLWMQL